jgi:hypothetical protein
MAWKRRVPHASLCVSVCLFVYLYRSSVIRLDCVSVDSVRSKMVFHSIWLENCDINGWMKKALAQDASWCCDDPQPCTPPPFPFYASVVCGLHRGMEQEGRNSVLVAMYTVHVLAERRYNQLIFLLIISFFLRFSLLLSATGTSPMPMLLPACCCWYS